MPRADRELASELAAWQLARRTRLPYHAAGPPPHTPERPDPTRQAWSEAARDPNRMRAVLDTASSVADTMLREGFAERQTASAVRTVGDPTRRRRRSARPVPTPAGLPSGSTARRVRRCVRRLFVSRGAVPCPHSLPACSTVSFSPCCSAQPCSPPIRLRASPRRGPRSAAAGSRTRIWSTAGARGPPSRLPSTAVDAGQSPSRTPRRRTTRG